MAISREELLNNLQKAGAYWNTGVTFKRTNPVPIEMYSIFGSSEDASSYSTNNPVAYVGQIITVIEDGAVTHYTIKNAEGDLEELIPRSNTGTKTYLSIEAASKDLPNLTQGQIITVVNENTADAYIVGYQRKTLVKIAGSNADITTYPISIEDLDLILSGKYEGEPLSDTEKAMIDSILAGTYNNDASEDQKVIIDSIIAGTYMEA